MRIAAPTSRLLIALLLAVLGLPALGGGAVAQAGGAAEADRQEFARVRAALGATDVPGRLRLAAWAARRGMRQEARKTWREVLTLDPDCAPAHRALGHVRLRDGWTDDKNVREAERAVLRARFEKAGLVRHGRGWETPEGARKRARGLEYADGKWRTPDMARAARGDVRIDGKWVGAREALCLITRRRLGRLTGATFHTTLGRRVIVATEDGGETGGEIGDAMDKAVADLYALRRTVGAPSPWTSPVRAIVLTRPGQVDAVNAWIPYHAGRAHIWFKPDVDRVGLRLHVDAEKQPILVVYVPDGDPAVRARAARGLLVYGVTRLAVASLARTDTPPFWLAEGLAVFTQITRAPGGLVTCAGDKPPALRDAGAFAGPRELRRLLDKQGVVPLEKLMALTPGATNERDLAQFALTIMFLTGRYPRAVAALLAPAARKPAIGETHDSAERLVAVTGKPLAELDKEFQAWVKP